ncbi:MAG TPA: MFS transporter [Candidatus Saccharimonadales bacterium]|nr:MFS transporter [Candidatus Saccharimonadales bacterium]
MNPQSLAVQRTFLTLLFCNTLAASLIWGVNTLFLLDAGLSNFEAFAANAFFTVGMVLFEVPTGVIADLKGRRLSFLLGSATLVVSTLLYVWLWQIAAPFWAWAAVSVFLGLGFTFFSGAVEAWLVDALNATDFRGKVDTIFAKGQIVTGIAMLLGSFGGGLIAQLSNLGVPYVLRALILAVTFVLALMLMRDLGFKPVKSERPLKEVKRILNDSIKYGIKVPQVRWVMLTAPFVMGVSIYGFYALQPYLLELWGDQEAYAIAGLAAAILAGAQIAGGLLATQLWRFFSRRTTILVTGITLSAVVLVLIGLITNFWAAIGLVVLWGLAFASTIPARQAYINGLIPSKQRATVLSFDSLLGSGGGVVAQPLLGKAADIWSYSTSYILAGGIIALAVPFAILARKSAKKGEAKIADQISRGEDPAKAQ